jgi:hypothetical protein
MRNALFVAIVWSLSSCAITQEEAVGLTKRELQSRQLPLPRGYRVDVVPLRVTALNENTGSANTFLAYDITYRVHGKDWYAFTVYRQLPHIREFEDKRHWAPAETKKQP